MIEIENPQLFVILMVLHCIIGTAAAFVAKQKGRNFNTWLIGGLIGGTPALITALLVSPLSRTSE